VTCERCERMETAGAKRGVYICEYFCPEERHMERQFGPYCSSRCANLAARRGATRGRLYTQPRYSAKQATTFAPLALPISKAPRRSKEPA